uniref:Uncharacterized protein n=1 Tax=Magallana gigas TaxID=29159 RepID=K1QNL1_MAGGI
MSESEHPEIQGHFHNVIKPPNPKKFKDNKIKKNRQRNTFLEGKMMRILSVLLMALYLLSCASAYVIYRMGPIYRRPIYRAYYNHDIDDDNIVYLASESYYLRDQCLNSRME